MTATVPGVSVFAEAFLGAELNLDGRNKMTTSDEDRKKAEEYAETLRIDKNYPLSGDKIFDGEGNLVTIFSVYLAGLEEGRRSPWVKCSERMPESDGYYLVCPCGKYHGHEVQFATVGFNRVPANSFFYETEDSYDTSYHPIQPEYWMPLPPPPVEESKS